MERFIVRLNIHHFRKMLTSEADVGTRNTVLRLLAEEEAKLQSLMAQPDAMAPEFPPPRLTPPGAAQDTEPPPTIAAARPAFTSLPAW